MSLAKEVTTICEERVSTKPGTKVKHFGFTMVKDKDKTWKTTDPRGYIISHRLLRDAKASAKGKAKRRGYKVYKNFKMANEVLSLFENKGSYQCCGATTKMSPYSDKERYCPKCKSTWVKKADGWSKQSKE